jgi:hypothetical protein
MLGLSALILSVIALPAQQANQLDQLRQQLEKMQANFDRVVREQQMQIEALKKQIETLSGKEGAPTNAPVGPAAGGQAATPPGSAPPAAVQDTSWSLTDPIRVGKGNAYVDIGLVATFAAGGSTARDIEGGTQLGGHDPNQRGFTVQGVELNLQGAVDPYFRGNANILFSVDSGGESFTELEEAWLETVSLPWNLQVRGGQILSDFGRVNTQHPHSWAFVDSPLVNARFLGPDGLRNPGVRLGWLMPVPFFSELSLGLQNSQGETAASFRSDALSEGRGEDDLPFGYRFADNDRGIDGIDDLLFTPRLATSFDLTDSQTLLLGVSAALGPNSSGSSGDTTTQVYGVDAYWKWKSPKAHGGFPFVSWQAEAMLRRYAFGAFDWQDAADGGLTPIIDTGTGLPASFSRESVSDYGVYSQWLYGFRKGWVAGFRVDYVTGDKANYEKRDLTFNAEALGRDPLRNERWRLSPNLTWYPSEFSKIRLQYNYDDRRDIGVDHSVWLQFEFLLGAHAAHKF